MTEAQHTPYYVTSSGGTISDVKTETVICTLATEPLSITHEVEDTAEFIVKACNSYDALVETVNHLRGILKDIIACPVSALPLIQHHLDISQRVLEQVKE